TRFACRIIPYAQSPLPASSARPAGDRRRGGVVRQGTRSAPIARSTSRTSGILDTHAHVPPASATRSPNAFCSGVALPPGFFTSRARNSPCLCHPLSLDVVTQHNRSAQPVSEFIRKNRFVPPCSALIPPLLTRTTRHPASSRYCLIALRTSFSRVDFMPSPPSARAVCTS